MLSGYAADHMPLAVGSVAPDFQLTADDGSQVRLSDLKGSPVVLFFYPRDRSRGCSREACGFRDNYAAFREFGAVLLGISSDGIESHQRFVAEQRLPYRLLSDPGGVVGRCYRVGKWLGILPNRVTFVIDATGVIRSVFESQLLVEEHVGRALAAVRGLGRVA